MDVYNQVQLGSIYPLYKKTTDMKLFITESNIDQWNRMSYKYIQYT